MFCALPLSSDKKDHSDSKCGYQRDAPSTPSQDKEPGNGQSSGILNFTGNRTHHR